jgi:hypothetical protein
MPETDTTIRLSQETKNKLEKLGAKGDTYDDIVKRLLENAEKQPTR